MVQAVNFQPKIKKNDEKIVHSETSAILPPATVAVIDTFAPKLNVIPQIKILDSSNSVNQGEVSHGDIVAGIIRAEGVAVKECPLPVLTGKVLTSDYWKMIADTTSQVADGIEHKQPGYENIHVGKWTKESATAWFTQLWTE